MDDRTADRTRALVMRAIAVGGPLSRSAIARHLGLSVSVVSRAVSDLERRGLVVEVATSPASGPGRPERLVALNDGFGYVFGVNLAGPDLHAVLTTLAGRQVGSLAGMAETTAPGELARTAAGLFSELLARTGISRASVIAAGVSVAGLVDAREGVCRRSTVLGWEHVPIGRILGDALELTVSVDNDANAVAVAEHTFGNLRGRDDAVMVTVGRGVGAGILVGGEILSGATGGAGEIGHITVDPGGEVCRCGKRGCLETLASIPALRRRVEQALGHEITGRELDLVLRGSEPARAAAAEAGRALGTVLASVVNLLNTPLIVIAGNEVDLSPLEGFVWDAIRAHAVPDLCERLEVRFQRLPSSIWSLGAASLAVQRLLSSLEWVSPRVGGDRHGH